MIGRILAGVGLAMLGFGLLVGVEVWLALRREYLPTDDFHELDARVGFGGGEPVTLVVLGDSTAAGIGAESPSQTYPAILAARFARAIGRAVELKVLGVSGARVADVADTQAPKAVGLGPDVVVVAIGANDVTHLTPLGSVRAGMARTLDVLAGSDATVIVAGAPDMRAIAWHQPLRWLAYLRGVQVAGAIEEVARARGVAVVELAERTGPHFARDPARHFSSDGFHPSGTGYERWADAIFPVLLRAWQQRR